MQARKEISSIIKSNNIEAEIKMEKKFTPKDNTIGLFLNLNYSRSNKAPMLTGNIKLSKGQGAYATLGEGVHASIWSEELRVLCDHWLETHDSLPFQQGKSFIRMGGSTSTVNPRDRGEEAMHKKNVERFGNKATLNADEESQLQSAIIRLSKSAPEWLKDNLRSDEAYQTDRLAPKPA
jgi:hypothetical protein